MGKIDHVKHAVERGLMMQKISQVSRSVTFEAPVKINDTGCLGEEKIGMLTYIGKGSEIKNCDIGRFCSIARDVTIGPPEHPLDWVSSHPMQYNGLRWFDKFDGWEDFADDTEGFRGNRKRTVIGHDVWIGRGAVIRQGVKVGVGAVIGSNAFVNKDVDPYTIVGGVPARVIRKRFDDALIERLLKSEWWDFQMPKHVRALFSKPIEFVDALEEAKESGSAIRYQPEIVTVKRDGKDYFIQQ